ISWMRRSRASSAPRIGLHANLPSTNSNARKMITVQIMRPGLMLNSPPPPAPAPCSWTMKRRFMASFRLHVPPGSAALGACTPGATEPDGPRSQQLEQQRDHETEQRRAFDQRRQNDRGRLDVARGLGLPRDPLGGG